MSVQVNIYETLPINKIVVPQLRSNEITENQDESKTSHL